MSNPTTTPVISRGRALRPSKEMTKEDYLDDCYDKMANMRNGNLSELLRVLDWNGTSAILIETNEEFEVQGTCGVPGTATQCTTFDDEGLLLLRTIDNTELDSLYHILIGHTSYDEDCPRRYVILKQKKSLQTRFMQWIRKCI